jgi:glyoxylase-like metal-dependent hydrolase (beta-lactamase superfamily II)
MSAPQDADMRAQDADMRAQDADMRAQDADMRAQDAGRRSLGADTAAVGWRGSLASRGMDLIAVTPRLHLLRFDVGQCYLWRDDHGLTLVDSGPRGSGDEIADAVERIGGSRAALHTVVVTHGHGDHTGSLAEIRRWSDAPVLAHELEADCVGGDRAPSPPVLEEWERPLYARVEEHLAGPPAPVDATVAHGDVLYGGLRVLHVPGHTEGSIALYEPDHRVLFTGDTLAEHDGAVIPGVFNRDRTELMRSIRALSELDVETLCFGHGDPVVRAAGAALRRLVA